MEKQDVGNPTWSSMAYAEKLNTYTAPSMEMLWPIIKQELYSIDRVKATGNQLKLRWGSYFASRYITSPLFIQQ